MKNLGMSMYIRRGYRAQLGYTQCWISVFQWHNETLNIWTHLCGALMFLWLGVNAPSYDADPIKPLFCFSLSFCFNCSWIYHALCCNDSYYHIALASDVTGIFGIIIACVGTAIMHITSFPPIVAWQNFHVRSFLLVASVSWFVMVSGVLRHGSVRGITPCLCIFATFSYWLVCVGHLWFLSSAMATTAMSLWLPDYLAWGIAFLAFLSCCPERLKAEVFDHVGNSHQIFHVLVVCCAYLHFYNVILSRKGMFPELRADA